MRAPIDVDRLWPSLRATEDTSRRGTELLRALQRLLIRNNPSSESWQEERRKILDAIEALLAEKVASVTEQQPSRGSPWATKHNGATPD